MRYVNWSISPHTPFSLSLVLLTTAAESRTYTTRWSFSSRQWNDEKEKEIKKKEKIQHTLTTWDSSREVYYSRAFSDPEPHPVINSEITSLCSAANERSSSWTICSSKAVGPATDSWVSTPDRQDPPNTTLCRNELVTNSPSILSSVSSLFKNFSDFFLNLFYYPFPPIA